MPAIPCSQKTSLFLLVLFFPTRNNLKGGWQWLFWLWGIQHEQTFPWELNIVAVVAHWIISLRKPPSTRPHCRGKWKYSWFACLYTAGCERVKRTPSVEVLTIKSVLLRPGCLWVLQPREGGGAWPRWGWGVIDLHKFSMLSGSSATGADL